MFAYFPAVTNEDTRSRRGRFWTTKSTISPGTWWFLREVVSRFLDFPLEETFVDDGSQG